MKNREKERSEKLFGQLGGMHHGTARHRLARIILFNLIQQLEKDLCFRCNKLIQTVEELSIDHKIPWENEINAKELFWNLENIAFSHLICNTVHARKNTEGRRLGYLKIKQHYADKSKKNKTDKCWCYVCKKELSLENFTKNSKKSNGLQDECKKCRSKRRKELRLQKQGKLIREDSDPNSASTES